MLAMVYTAPLELKMLDVDEPTPARGEVVIEVAAVGICGSELEGFASKSPFRVPPLIMGHEFSGRRMDTGEPVAVNPVVSCGGCDMCLRGMSNICRDRKILGIQRAGAFAQRVVVPERNCYLLPEDVPLVAAALVEPFANAIHAFRLLQQADPLPLRIGVIGAGTLGYLVAWVAQDRGTPHIAVAELSPERRDIVQRSGSYTVSDHLEGEFDAIFDAVGSSATRRTSLELLRPGGTAVWLGLHGPEPGIDGLALIRDEKRVLGTFCYQDVDFRAAVARVAAVNPSALATHPLDEGVGVFERLISGEVSSLKTLLLPSDGS
ncbi:MAG: alcohol dehydrogenase catalytic domain-containing protein [Actinomycetota bacterium]|nr:alcohol dehydrogenase catalytic domain-containing protein [Actinomycetota bacterium]